uniref:NADH-ubiquinone oxidoreductase chain 6 n=1 Tax=Leptogaster longicauda TaxID=1812705 RepID=A0A161G6I5_9MUSC|nr:NADH dehydrogenase subunit 6 [Leptogaster longicauda]
MEQFMLMQVAMITGLLFMKSIHPLALGLMLLCQTLIISLLSGMISKTFWFSYILFLIFLGGMLVLFIYVTSLASNEMFTFSMKLMVSCVILFTLFSFLMLTDNFLFNFEMNNEMQSLNNTLSYFSENSINLMKLYNSPTNMVTILLMSYLLITLIVVVKVTNIFYGPLRKMS